MRAQLLLLLAGAHAAPLAPPADDWEDLRAAIDAFPLVTDCVVSVGDSRGELFRHAKGATTFDTEMRIFSATKWVSGVMIVSAVEDGLLGLDDLAYEHLGYWTRDPENPRSRVTLRHLLSFTSGMGGSTSCPAEMDFATCVSDMYGRSSQNSEPGSQVVYNEVHLQYAGAMTLAAAGAGTTIEDLFERYVFGPAGMNETRFNGRAALGAGLLTTPAQYGRFLNEYFNHRLVSEAGRTEMERSSYPDAALSGLALLQGRYGLGNWFDCIPAIPFTAECEALDCHSSTGIAGYVPVTDRRLNYWINIGFEGATGLGAVNGVALRLAIKPVANAAILSSRGLSPSAEGAGPSVEAARELAMKATRNGTLTP